MIPGKPQLQDISLFKAACLSQWGRKPVFQFQLQSLVAGRQHPGPKIKDVLYPSVSPFLGKQRYVFLLLW